MKGKKEKFRRGVQVAMRLGSTGSGREASASMSKACLFINTHE